MSAVDDKPEKIVTPELDHYDLLKTRRKSEFMDRFARDLGVKAGMLDMKQQEAKK